MGVGAVSGWCGTRGATHAKKCCMVYEAGFVPGRRRKRLSRKTKRASMLVTVVGLYGVAASEPQRGGPPDAPGRQVVLPSLRPRASASKPASPVEAVNFPPRNVQ